MSAQLIYFEEAEEYLCLRVPELTPVIRELGTVRREGEEDIFISLLHHITGQQISSKAQETIWNRFIRSIGILTPENIMCTDEGILKESGLSGRKVIYIKELASQILNGSFCPGKITQMSDKEAISYLTRLKGIGEWTAEMVLIFCLRRPDILSLKDTGIQRGIRMLLQSDKKTDIAYLQDLKRRCSPYGTAASFYFWEAAGGKLGGITAPAADK